MTMFDPETGKVSDPEALRSLQIAGSRRKPRVVVDRETDTKKVEVIHEGDGGTAGVQTVHGSGRVDANVFARAAQMTTVQGE